MLNLSLIKANLDELVKNSFKLQTKEVNEDSLTIPVTNCPIYIRIQPCLAPLPAYTPTALPSATDNLTSASDSRPTPIALFFLLLLRDPTHNIIQSSMSQSIPAAWLEIPFEENEWVEDIMVDVLRSSIQTIGQEVSLPFKVISKSRNRRRGFFRRILCHLLSNVLH